MALPIVGNGISIADDPASEKLDNPPEKADIQIAEREATPSERLSSSNNDDVAESHKDERSLSEASDSESTRAISGQLAVVSNAVSSHSEHTTDACPKEPGPGRCGVYKKKIKS
jgi:hypothetical protein